MMPITRLKRITGERRGMVTYRKRSNGPAPSIAAASRHACEMFFNPARKMSALDPNPQRLRMIRVGFARYGSSNQIGVEIPSKLRMLLIGPASGLNRSRNTIVLATGGVSDGR